MTLKDRLRHSALGRLGRYIGDFLRPHDGGVAILMAGALVPLVGSLGLATDTARGYMTQSRLQTALDQAVLAGGRQLFSGNALVLADATKVFNANFSPGFMGSDPVTPAFNIIPAAGSTPPILNATAEATIPTTFVRVLPSQPATLTVAAQNQAQISIYYTEIAIAFDISGSMNSPITGGSGKTKYQGLRDAINAFLDVMYLPDGSSPSLTLDDGTTLSLLHVAMVPFQAKVRIIPSAVWNAPVDGQAGFTAFNTALTEMNVPAFINPYTGQAQNTVWMLTKSNNTAQYPNAKPAGANVPMVPLLFNPAAPGRTWFGCVYARHIEDGDISNDADVIAGEQRGLGNTKPLDWVGFMPTMRGTNDSWGEAPNGDITTIVNSNWWLGFAKGWGSDPSVANWSGEQLDCVETYWNDEMSDTVVDGGATGDTDSLAEISANYPSGIINNANTNGTLFKMRPAWFDNHYPPIDRVDSTSFTYQSNYRNRNGQSMWDCRSCQGSTTPYPGVLPMQDHKQIISDMLLGITPGYFTNVPQGLYWAWETLTPGLPYDDSPATLPISTIPRRRAIILVTDGANNDVNGGAYMGAFGWGRYVDGHSNLCTIAPAYTDTSGNCLYNSATYDLKHPPITVNGLQVTNNLRNRTRLLAENIKNTPFNGVNTEIFVVDWGSGSWLRTDVASRITAPHYMNAPNYSTLVENFRKIAIEMSEVKLIN